MYKGYQLRLDTVCRFNVMKERCRKRHTSTCGVLGQANPLCLPFGVVSYEVLLLHIMNADDVGSTGQTVISSSSPTSLI